MEEHHAHSRKWLFLPFFALFLSNVGLSQATESFYDIYAMDVKRGQIFQVTDVPGMGEYNPSWAPNSMFIVHDLFDPALPFEQMLAITDIRTKATRILERTFSVSSILIASAAARGGLQTARRNRTRLRGPLPEEGAAQ